MRAALAAGDCCSPNHHHSSPPLRVACTWLRWSALTITPVSLWLQSSFRHLHVLGQFNLGFIIARTGSDLFILDQHACDEKFRFETLQQSTTMHGQPLIRSAASR